MPLKLGPITPEMEEAILKAFQEEKDFWSRNGFPDYSSSDMTGMANPAHRKWVSLCSREGRAYDSPMARRCFVLGYLTAMKEPPDAT